MPSALTSPAELTVWPARSPPAPPLITKPVVPEMLDRLTEAPKPPALRP